MKILLLFVALTCLSACRAQQFSVDPFDGYYITVSNSILPITGVYRQGQGDQPLTNWLCVTSDSSPKIITSVLKAPRTVTAKPGQIWISGAASYINTPEVSEWVGETNKMWVMPTHQTTNNWPQLSQVIQLIFVRRIEKADAGRVKGLDYYAHCRVRLWSDCVMVEGEKIISLPSLTNNCTLVNRIP